MVPIWIKIAFRNNSQVLPSRDVLYYDVAWDACNGFSLALLHRRTYKFAGGRKRYMEIRGSLQPLDSKRGVTLSLQ
jgi:hypothetical protein